MNNFSIFMFERFLIWVSSCEVNFIFINSFQIIDVEEMDYDYDYRSRESHSKPSLLGEFDIAITLVGCLYCREVIILLNYVCSILSCKTTILMINVQHLNMEHVARFFGILPRTSWDMFCPLVGQSFGQPQMK